MAGRSRPAGGRLRATLLVLCLLGPPLAVLSALVLVSVTIGLFDGNRPRAFTDYPIFYLVAVLAPDIGLAPLYDPAVVAARSQAVLGYVETQRPLWYPPTFALLLLPFGLLALIPSLLAWTAANALVLTGWFYLHAKRNFALLAVLVCPGALYSYFAGQNGGLTAGLLGGGLLALRRYPYLAGVLFGLATIKPQLGLLIPVALIAGREWRTFFAAALTAIVFALVSLAVFGPGAWAGHLSAIGLGHGGLEQASRTFFNMVTVLSMLHQFGLGGVAGLIVQALSAAAMAGLVFWVWRRNDNEQLRVSVLIIAAYLATPYAYGYDLVLLALPLIWWAQAIDAEAPKPLEMALLAGFWLYPFAALTITHIFMLQFWPIYFLVLLFICWRRLGAVGRTP